MFLCRESASLFLKEVYDTCGCLETSLGRLQDAVMQCVVTSRKESGIRYSKDQKHECLFDVFSVGDSNKVANLRRCAREGRLVRCLGMIQDIQREVTVMSGSPECFLSPVPQCISSGSCDAANEENREQQVTRKGRDLGGRNLCHVETAVLRVIPVPGSTWLYEDGVDNIGDEKYSKKCCRSTENQHSHQGEMESFSAVSLKGGKEENKSIHSTFAIRDSLTVAQKATEQEMNFPQPSSHPALHASCMVTVLAPRYENRVLAKENLSKEKSADTTSSISSIEGSEADFLSERSPFQINDVCEFFGYLEDDDDDRVNTQIENRELDAQKKVSRKKEEESMENREENNSDDDDDEKSKENGMQSYLEMMKFPDDVSDEPWSWHPTESYRQAGALVSHLISVAVSVISSANAFDTPLGLPRELEVEEKESENAAGYFHLSALQFGCTTLSHSSPPPEWFEDCRSRSIHFLSQHVCHGDILVAEYLLLHLCSQVLAHPSATPLGDVPLLIRYPPSLLSQKKKKIQKMSEIKEDQGRKYEEEMSLVECWKKALHRMVPVAVVTIDKGALQQAAGSSQSPPPHAGKKRTGKDRSTLGLKRYLPRALAPQYESSGSYLFAGSLQLANGTNLLIDCKDILCRNSPSSSLESDTLENENSSLFGTLFALVHQCRLPIDYPYCRVELPVSLSFLALAPEGEALPDMLAFPISILLHDHSSFESTSSPDDSLRAEGCEVEDQQNEMYQNDAYFSVTGIRSYLAFVRRQATINFSLRKQYLTSTVMEMITECFTKLGEEFDEWNNHSSLIHNNIFSALTSLMGVEAASRGSHGISPKDIDHIVALERKRISSFRSRTCCSQQMN